MAAPHTDPASASVMACPSEDSLGGSRGGDVGIVDGGLLQIGGECDDLGHGELFFVPGFVDVAASTR